MLATQGAFKDATKEQLQGTLKELRYYKRFLASACNEAVCPRDGWTRITRHDAGRRLTVMLHTAINRKAGLADFPAFNPKVENEHGAKRGVGEGRALNRIPRKYDQDWQNQTRRLARDLNTPRLAIHWMPKEWRERFAHRLSEAY